MLSLLNLIEIQNSQPETAKQLKIPENLIEFLNQTILGILYGIENPNKSETLNFFNLPEIEKNKNTLIFDLDETLVTSNIEPSKATLTFAINTNSQISKFHVAVRPYAKEILEYLSNYYEIIIFTASHIDYAKKIIEYLDPSSTIIKAIVDRPYCYQTPHGIFVKDLKVFKNIDLTSTLLIDNSSLSYCYQPKNGVPIISWYGNDNDRELIALAQYLKGLLDGEGNLVEKHRSKFSVKTLLNFYSNLQF